MMQKEQKVTIECLGDTKPSKQALEHFLKVYLEMLAAEGEGGEEKPS